MVFDGCAGQGDSVRVGFTVFHAGVRFFVGDMIVVVHITVLVSSLEQLSRLFSRIEGVRGVSSVTRTIQSVVHTA